MTRKMTRPEAFKSLLKSAQQTTSQITSIREIVKSNIEFPDEEERKMLEEIDRDCKVILRQAEIINSRYGRLRKSLYGSLQRDMTTYLRSFNHFLKKLAKLNLI